MIKILILGYKKDIWYFQKSLEDLGEIVKIFETSTLEGFIAIAKEKNPRVALIDFQLIQDETYRMVYNLNQFVPEILFYIGICHFTDKPLVQVHRCMCEAPSFLQKAIKDAAKGFGAKDGENGLLIFKTKTGILNVNKKNIVFIESYNGRCSIHTRECDIEVRNNLKDLEKIVGENFFRVHRSFLVNINEIKRVKNICDRCYEVEFLDFDKTALMSRYRYQLFQEYMKQLC